MNEYVLSKGSHATAADGRCAMEWVAYLAGERHSASPGCVSDVLRRFCAVLNDRLEHGPRQRLRPYLTRTIGTAGDGRDAERERLCREFLVRRALPLYLDAAGRREAAARLRALPAVLTGDETRAWLSFARDEAWSARQAAGARLRTRIPAEVPRRVAATGTGAVAAAAAGAGADADAIAGAAAVAAVAAAVCRRRGYRIFNYAVRDRMVQHAREVTGPIDELLMPEVFGLLDRMLPTEIIEVPVEWREVCAV